MGPAFGLVVHAGKARLADQRAEGVEAGEGDDEIMVGGLEHAIGCADIAVRVRFGRARLRFAADGVDRDFLHLHRRHRVEHIDLDELPLARALAMEQRRSEEHTSELQSLMRSSYAVFCLQKKINNTDSNNIKINTKTLKQHIY